jgi:hypothetical protein
MKKSTILEVAIKITGLVALWHTVTALPSLFAGITIFMSALSNFGTQGGFMAIIGLTMFLNIFLAAFFAYLCLVKTGALMRLFRFDTEEEVNLAGDKTVLFDIVVFLAAIFLLAGGLTNLVRYDYKTDYKTESVHQPATNQMSPKSTVMESQTKQVNYFAILQILAGVFFLSNGRVVSNWLTRKYGYYQLPDEKLNKDEPSEFNS